MLIIALMLMILGKKITLRDRIILGQSLNNNSLNGLVKLTRKILKYTFTFEIIGAILIAIVYVPEYGFKLGLFKSVFQAISAFCNAGFDLIGNNSLIPYATNKIINIVCMLLTILGGLGFLAWDDIGNTFFECIKKKRNIFTAFSKLKLHSKLVLILQFTLIILGTIGFMTCEFSNDLTIASYSFEDKLLVSIFQSVSTRTAGFMTVDLSNINPITKILMIILMFIGGAPGSVAGGVKTTTFFVLILGVVANIKSKKNISVFKRTISEGTFAKAVTVITISLLVVIISNIVLIANSDIDSLDLLFETTSAFSTAGLTCGALSKMNEISKSVIVLLMYVGRIGTMTMAVSFVMKKPKEKDLVVYAKEDVIVG